MEKFFDIKKERDARGIEDIALLRLEQLYPFPYHEVRDMLMEYSHVSEFIWCQEEPKIKGHGLVKDIVWKESWNYQALITNLN